MNSYEYASHLVLGGVVILFLLYLAVYLVNKNRDKHNDKKRDGCEG